METATVSAIDREIRCAKSRELALKLYDRWIRERQNRPDLKIGANLKEVERAAKENFTSQVVKPREKSLSEMRGLKKSMEFPDQVALLAMMELPVLEASALLHRLGRQIAADPEAKYFSPVNMADNCGCGCGCGCGAMASLDLEERLALHHQAKPFSVDPFNELETPAEVRDNLLVREFLASYQAISEEVGVRVNRRYFQMGRDFA
jgi:hypothetical protein